MEKRGNDPLQEELRSSQVYHVLTGLGHSPWRGSWPRAWARPLLKGLDQALNLGREPGSQAQGGHPYQAPPQQRAVSSAAFSEYLPGAAPDPPRPRQTPPSQGAPQPSQGAARIPRAAETGNGYYHYSYRNKGAAQQARASGRRSDRPSRRCTSPQSKAQRVAAAQPGRGRPAGRASSRAAAATPAAKAGQRPSWPAAVPAGRDPQAPMKMVRAGSPAKFYITAAAALIYATSAPLYEPYHFVIFAAVLVLVFLGSSALFRGKKVFVPIQPEKPKEEPKKEPEKVEKSQTGNPEVDKIIDEGREYLKKLRAADDAIPDETLSEDITRMERASAGHFPLHRRPPGEGAPNSQIHELLPAHHPEAAGQLSAAFPAEREGGEHLLHAVQHRRDDAHSGGCL